MMKIAITSSDGKKVNTSLGKARMFYIYEVRNDEYFFLEKRQSTSLSNKDEYFDDDRLEKLYRVIKDCRLLYASEIEPRTAFKLKRKGILSQAIEKDINNLIS